MLGAAPTQAILSTDGATLYVSDAAASHVVPVEIGTRQIGPPVTTGQGPDVIEFAPIGDMALVVDTGSDDLAAIRTDTNALITLVPVGRSPRDLAIKQF